MQMENQCCGTCNMAHFAKTPTGRFVKGRSSRCAYHIPMPVLPSCVVGEPVRAADYLDRHKGNVWPDGGTDCPLWAPKGL
jgi:hypothetical protein